MTNKKKRHLKIILPIVALLLIVLIIILLIPKGIHEKNYFNALRNSNYTKQEQLTTITEGELVVYEKLETIVFDGENIYHKITEKKISSGTEMYEEIAVELYYNKTSMYYYENEQWKTVEFNVKNSLKTYNLKKEYFTTISFDKKVEEQGILEGYVKDECVNDAFNSETQFHSAHLKLIVNKNFKVQECNIQAKTSSNRDVKVNNVFTYNNEVVILPN